MANPFLASAADTALLVVDVQEKLFHMTIRHEAVERDILFLLDVAAVLNLPIITTEQYPKGLGGTIPTIATKLTGPRYDKLTFSCCGNRDVVEFFHREARPKIIVVGIETHVCVQQTCLDLLNENFRVFLPVDAVSCRYPMDHHVALRRMENAGVTLTTAEALAFELCGCSGTPEFKAISKLVQERMKSLALQGVNH